MGRFGFVLSFSRIELFQIWEEKRSVMGGSRICFKFQTGRSVLQRGRLKWNCGRKSRPNFWLFQPLCKIRKLDWAKYESILKVQPRTQSDKLSTGVIAPRSGRLEAWQNTYKKIQEHFNMFFFDYVGRSKRSIFRRTGEIGSWQWTECSLTWRRLQHVCRWAELAAQSWTPSWSSRAAAVCRRSSADHWTRSPGRSPPLPAPTTRWRWTPPRRGCRLAVVLPSPRRQGDGGLRPSDQRKLAGDVTGRRRPPAETRWTSWSMFFECL